jgi:hypothetical protein
MAHDGDLIGISKGISLEIKRMQCTTQVSHGNNQAKRAWQMTASNSNAKSCLSETTMSTLYDSELCLQDTRYTLDRETKNKHLQPI